MMRKVTRYTRNASAMTKEPKPLKYKTLEGLSERQLAEHHDVLYAGYVKKWNEIQEKLKTKDLTSMV